MFPGMQVTYTGIRQNKKMLFGLFGFTSGMLGALISECIYIVTPVKQTMLVGIFTTALSAGLFSAMIATGLFYAIDVYSHRKADKVVLLKKSIPAGFIAGAISGGTAQAIFASVSNLLSNMVVLFLLQSVCWGILGLILGWRISKAIPNLGTQRATIAGFIGGFIGGAGFLIVGSFLELLPGHILGIGIMGAALGLCIVVVEERSRVSHVEVHWTPDEVSYFTLGSTPVFIGAGDSDICVPSVVNHAMSLTIEGGHIFGTDHTKRKKKELFYGNHINIGKIDMIVRSGIEKMKTSRRTQLGIIIIIACIFTGVSIAVLLSLPSDQYIKIGHSQYLFSKEAQQYLQIGDTTGDNKDKSILIIQEPHSNLGQQFNLYKGLGVFFKDNPDLIKKTLFLAEGYPSQQEISVQPLIDVEQNPDEETIKDVLGSYLINGYIAYVWKTNNGITIIGTENDDLYNLSVTELLTANNPENESIWKFTVAARNEKIAETVINSSTSYENPILFIGGLHLTPQDESSFRSSQQHFADQNQNLDMIKTAKNLGIQDYLEEEKIGYIFLEAKSDTSTTNEDLNLWYERYTELFYAQRTGNYDEYINSILSEDYGIDYTPENFYGVTVRPAITEAAYFAKAVKEGNLTPKEGNLTPARGLPPNSTTIFPKPWWRGPFGRTERIAGPDGNATWDKDFGDPHGKCPEDHCHYWNWSHINPKEECIPCPPEI